MIEHKDPIIYCHTCGTLLKLAYIGLSWDYATGCYLPSYEWFQCPNMPHGWRRYFRQKHTQASRMVFSGTVLPSSSLHICESYWGPSQRHFGAERVVPATERGKRKNQWS